MEIIILVWVFVFVLSFMSISLRFICGFFDRFLICKDIIIKIECKFMKVLEDVIKNNLLLVIYI